MRAAELVYPTEAIEQPARTRDSARLIALPLLVISAVLVVAGTANMGFAEVLIGVLGSVAAAVLADHD